MELKDINNIFFLGIGGIGMSALARYFHAEGAEVSGYDKTSTALTIALQNQGINVGHTDDPGLLPKGCQLVVVTPAVPVTTELYKAISSRNIPMLKRAQVLGMLSHNIPTIAIAGTHGKTTISTMIAHILRTAGIRFNAFLGGISANYNTNFMSSSNPEWMVVEADEFDRSFLHLSPDIAIITSIDPDHLDIYGSAESLAESFTLFAHRVNPKGTLLIRHGLDIGGKPASRVKTYHQNQPCHYYAEDISAGHNLYSASLRGEITIDKIKLGLPGRHNLENAIAAIGVAHLLGITPGQIALAMESFKGVKRRFEYIIKNPDLVYIDDYAHHPEELRACIESVRELFPGRKITGIFQPHLFSRTRDLSEGFAKSLALLDELYLMEIYPAREAPIQGITSKWLLDKIPMNQKQLASGQTIINNIKRKRPEVLLTMGAGNIDLLVDSLKDTLTKQTNK